MLDAWVVPKLDGVTVEWVPESDGGSQGFGVIRVPPQAESRKPFVIAKVVLDTGRRRDMLVGFAQRKRDKSEPATPSEIAKWLGDGRNYQAQLQGRLDEIIGRLEQLEGGAAPVSSGRNKGPDSDEVTARVQASLAATNLINRPHFVLAAIPDRSTQVETIFKSGPGTVTAVLENPPILRYAGWSLETLDQAKIIEGRFRQLTNGDRKVLRLYRDGVLIHAAAADSEFLGWGQSLEEFRDNPRLISLATIEVTYLFCLCYVEILKDLSTPPENIAFRFYLGGMHNKGTTRPVYLNPHGVNAFAFKVNHDNAPAPEDAVDRSISVSAAQFARP